MGVIKYVNQQFDRAITWDDAKCLAKQWDGPFIIKGLMSAADAKKAPMLEQQQSWYRSMAADNWIPRPQRSIV